MNDDEVARMGHELRREQDGSMVIVVICLVAIASATIGCALMWLAQKLMGIL